MKKIFIKLSLITALLNLSFAFSAPIKTIEILGLDAISRGTVLNYLPIEVGDEYAAKTSTQIIRDLYKTQFFKDIEVTQKKGILTISVMENPHIKYVDLTGYSTKVIDENSIKQTLSSLELVQGKIFNAKTLKKFIKELEATYINQGYYHISIDQKIETDKQNRIGVELTISEGEVARIKNMHIVGGKTTKEEDLLDLFEINEADFWPMNYFTEKDHYSKVALDAGIEAMKSYYTNIGYLDFKILKTDIELSASKTDISINIEIEEGNQYKIGAIQLSGTLLNETKEELSKLLSINTGDIFDRKHIISSIKSLTAAYKNQGYAFAEVLAVTNENKDTHTIDLNFKITPSKKIYINRILITGNTRTQGEVVRREISIYEGELYSDKKLKESIKKIKRLGFFSDVKMTLSKLAEAADKINLHFMVTEAKTGTLSVGLSRSNSTGNSFNLGVQEKNFLGTGNTLNASISNSKAVKNISFYFKNPYFTQDGHSLSYGIFSKTTDGAELDVSSYKINEKGGSVGYGIPITKDTRLSTELKLSSRSITCGTLFTSDEPTQCANGDKNEVKLNLKWDENTLNNYTFPTEGTSSYLNLGVTLPVADLKYYKFNASSKNYRPISKNLTLKIGGKLGLAQAYSDEELPFFERYYGGGSSSVRGFNFNSLGTKYASSGTSKGGELSILANATIISPLTFIKDSSKMRISAFVDVGGISEKATSFSSNDLRASAGAEFTWLTPIGPLGFYAARPILKKTGDDIKTFEFVIGANF